MAAAQKKTPARRLNGREPRRCRLHYAEPFQRPTASRVAMISFKAFRCAAVKSVDDESKDVCCAASARCDTAVTPYMPMASVTALPIATFPFRVVEPSTVRASSVGSESATPRVFPAMSVLLELEMGGPKPAQVLLRAAFPQPCRRQGCHDFLERVQMRRSEISR